MTPSLFHNFKVSRTMALFGMPFLHLYTCPINVNDHLPIRYALTELQIHAVSVPGIKEPVYA